jgi:hypothetical protein
MTRHNSGHDDDEHNSGHNSGHNDSEHNSGHNSGHYDGGNGHRRAYEAQQRDTKGRPLSLFCLSVRPLLLLRQKGDEDQLYCTATGCEASASLPQTDPS